MTQDANSVWVVIDEGCQECGVETLPIGVYSTEEEANAAAEASPTYEAGWRDGGQAYVAVYRMDLPKRSVSQENKT